MPISRPRAVINLSNPIDPARGAEIAFVTPYLLIQGGSSSVRALTPKKISSTDLSVRRLRVRLEQKVI